MGDWLFGWFYDLLYILQKSICYLLDFIRDVFCKLAGIETVVVDGEQSDLLSHFILSPQIRNAFLGVFLVGVILLFVFVMIAIIKSEAADPQHKKTKGQILVKALQSFIIFVLIPFLLIAAITLTNAIMSGIHASMTGAMIDGNTNSCIGGQILVTSGYDAYIGPSGQRAEIERMFITGQLDYNNLSVVKDYYDLGDMNFFVGIAGGLVILIMFVISAIMFVQRIFDIILLYIVSPASVSTIPLDDGGRFKIWREMLISKILGAYGIILSMNIFFLIVPQIGNISFFNNAFKDGIVQLLFVLGGAFAITKANMVIAQLTGSNAGAQEAQQMLGNISTGMHMMRTAGHIAAGTAGMVLGGTDFLTNRHHNATFTESLSSAIHSQRNQRPVIDRDDDTPPKGGGDGSGGSGGTDGTNKDGSTVQDAAAQNGNGNSTDTPTTTGTSDNATAKPAENNSDVSDAASAEAAANADMESVTDAEGSEAATGTSEESADVAEAAKSGVTFGSVVKGATRLATLPAGIAKDLIQGGIIVAGKNFGPRVRNVLKGTSIFNHADVKKPLAEAAKKSVKEDKKE
ncbi:MAG: hypothetical protein HDT29_05680 [Clostridiales bacterium]|nr:hypothetical protein [Clostridiales bacterium]